MNKDISGNIEHFEVSPIVVQVGILVGVIVCFTAGYFIYERIQKNKKISDNYNSSNGIVEETKPGIFSQFFDKKEIPVVQSNSLTLTTDINTPQLGGKRGNKKSSKKISNVDSNQYINIFMGIGIIILGYMLYRLYKELTTLKKLHEIEIKKTEKDNRDTIKIATPLLYGSINAGQYITNHSGYFMSNP